MKKFEFENTNAYAEYVKEQANEYLDRCKIYGSAENRNGLMDDVLMSIEAKSKLFDTIFKNNPYHNGKGQLIMPMEVERAIDSDVIYEYADYIRQIARRYFLVEAVIDGYTYKDALRRKENIGRFKRAVDYMHILDEDVIIQDRPFTEWRKEYLALQRIVDKFDDEYYYMGDESYTTYENKRLYDKAVVISHAIKSCIGKLLEDETDIKRLAEAFPHSQCRNGIKITRVIQKCMKELGLYQIAMDNEMETFNKRYAQWCDAVSPGKITKWSVLSINFVDFLAMSHGNSWTSCINTDKNRHFTSGNYSDGFNSRRTLDYALDETTMVFYTVDENYEGDDWELQPKQTRQLFHFGEGKLVQARLYPQSRTSRRNIYTQYRENVEKLIADGMGEANLWSAPIRGEIECGGSVVTTPYYYTNSGEYIDFLDIACHAGDETDFQSEVNYVVFRGSTNREDNGIPMVVGSKDAVCIICGDGMREGYHDAIACCDCY